MQFRAKNLHFVVVVVVAVVVVAYTQFRNQLYHSAQVEIYTPHIGFLIKIDWSAFSTLLIITLIYILITLARTHTQFRTLATLHVCLH